MIVAAAVKLDGVVYSVPKPGRHNHVYEKMHKEHPEFWEGEHPGNRWTDGFLTDTGEFLGRDQSWEHMKACNQPFVRTPTGGILTSEDIWETWWGFFSAEAQRTVGGSSYYGSMDGEVLITAKFKTKEEGPQHYKWPDAVCVGPIGDYIRPAVPDRLKPRYQGES